MFYPNGIATIDQRTLTGITNIERFFCGREFMGATVFTFTI